MASAKVMYKFSWILEGDKVRLRNADHKPADDGIVSRDGGLLSLNAL